MTIKSDKWIRESGILNPCYEFTNTKIETYYFLDDHEEEIRTKIISKGLSSYGYDLTCSNEFKIFKRIKDVGFLETEKDHIIDPKEFKDDCFTEHVGDYCIIPPNSFALTKSVEYITMPRDIIGICMGKSTYARCGVVANTTLIEPEWEGHLVIELSNTTPLPVKVYANEGIVQVVFYKTGSDCEVSYKDRQGKYNRQTGIQTAKV